MSEIDVTSAEPEVMVRLRLVPVEVFGEDACCEHGLHGENPGCPASGYGLSDAVSLWGDCNRAVGHIYRVDDSEPEYRQPGETVEVMVRRADLPFFERVFGDA